MKDKKTIVVILVVVLLVLSVNRCRSNHANKDDNGISSNKDVQEIDDAFRKHLGDYLVTSKYENDVYYAIIKFDKVNTFYDVVLSDMDTTFSELSTTIYYERGIENVIGIVSSSAPDEFIYATHNGYDITKEVVYAS